MIVGIDPSLSNTAVASERGVQCFGSKNLGESVRDRVRRYQRLVAPITSHVAALQPTAIFIEGYAFDSGGNTGKYLAEYGGILRWHLADLCEVYEIAPATLKRFITGKGNAKKEQIIAHVTKRHGVMFDSNDEYDSFALLQLGRAVKGHVAPSNQAQRDCIEVVLGLRQSTTTKRKRNRA